MDKASISQYIGQLNQIPPETHRILHKIRQTDEKVLQIAVELAQRREYLLRRLDGQPVSKGDKLEIQQTYHRIRDLQQRQLQLSKQKVSMAEDLYNLIDEPTEILDKQIAMKYPQLNESTKKKGKKLKQQNEWEYDACEPEYCHCKRPSFGEMIRCDNGFCEIQWFHLGCLQQKINHGDKWFCRECRKGGSKARSKRQHRI